jgi:N-acyl-D-aspartate/D-glutamate deacylase
MDLVIRGGTVIDGSGSPGVRADVGVQNAVIADIGTIEPDGVPSLDATDCIVAPGFIDIHSHSDFTLLIDPRAVSAITQGVTTEVVGNCGHGCAPVRDPEQARSNIYGFDPERGLRWTSMAGYLDAMDAARPAVNVASLVPNGCLRLAAVGVADRPSNQDELRQMQRLLRESIDGGAIGYSTGLEYGIERACSEEEIEALCSVAKERGRFYATHTRNLDEQPEETIAEAIHAARNSGIPLQISHLQVVARLTSDGSGAVARALEQIERARNEGIDVTFDMHTRLFGTTNLSAAIPAWALEGGKPAIEKRLRDESTRREMQRNPNIIVSLARGDWNRIVVFDSKATPEISRKSIRQLSEERGTNAFETIYDVLLDNIDDLHELMVIAYVYREEDIEAAFLHPLSMVGSDATSMATDGPLAGKVFHGAYTWASWYWSHFVHEKKLLSPEEAIRRLTSLPARRLGTQDRGILRRGACGDITVFEPDQVLARGTVFDPSRTATGVRHVIVNGKPALQDGVLTGTRSGRVLRS